MRRQLWRGYHLNFVADEPMFVSLLKYRQVKDRTALECTCRDKRQHNKPYPSLHRADCPCSSANILSSLTPSGRQLPVLDLDFPHQYLPSTTPGHGHLYLNVDLPWWRWALLMCGLRIGGVVEGGFFWWSLRRGSNFVRPPGVRKTEEERIRSEAPPKYAMFRRIR